MSAEAVRDQTLAYCLLRQDPFFGKIPPEALRRYVEEPLQAGAAAAKEHAGRPAQDWYEHYGIQIRYRQQGAIGGVRFRASINYSGRIPHITLYTNAIRELSAVCPHTEEAILAHELFHYLEVVRDRDTCLLLPRVVTARIGPWKQTAAIHAAGEIAAHKFAKDMAGLEYLGNYYDFLFLASEGSLDKGHLQGYLKRMEREYEKCTHMTSSAV